MVIIFYEDKVQWQAAVVILEVSYRGENFLSSSQAGLWSMEL
jgi:hypothetical protein